MVLLDDLGVVAPQLPEFAPLLRRIDESELARHLPRRRRDSHKGSHGRVLVIGGGSGMPGALRLAGEAALRAGAGLVTVAGAAENLVAVTATRPELIYLPVASGTSLAAAIRGADVLAIGPGLGRDDWAQRLWATILRAEGIPAVVDADALNLLALSPVKLPADWIITPHPGEAGRLLGSDAREVQADRLGAVRELHARYGAVVVLKGAGTLVASTAVGATELAICDRGNPGMATAGMGDVLTGVDRGPAGPTRRQRGRRASRGAGACAGGRFGGAGRTTRSGRQRRVVGVARLGESLSPEQAWLTRSGEETEALGGRLLGAAPGADAPCRVVTLSGELGAGKSTFARGVLRCPGRHGSHQEPELHAASKPTTCLRSRCCTSTCIA